MKLSVDELTRLAFVWAERDRLSLAQAWPEGSPERKKHESEYRQLNRYRLTKWGWTLGERILGEAKAVDVLSLKKSFRRKSK